MLFVEVAAFVNHKSLAGCHGSAILEAPSPAISHWQTRVSGGSAPALRPLLFNHFRFLSGTVPLPVRPCGITFDSFNENSSHTAQAWAADGAVGAAAAADAAGTPLAQPDDQCHDPSRTQVGIGRHMVVHAVREEECGGRRDGSVLQHVAAAGQEQK